MSKWKFIWLVLIFCTVGTNHCLGQNDVEFWFAAPDASSNHGDQPILIRISTYENACQISIGLEARKMSLANFKLGAYRDTTINLSTYKDIIENSIGFTPLANGIHITSDFRMAAYYEIAHFYNPAIFNLKGRNALGHEFVIPSQGYPTSYNTSTIDIVATEDSTFITLVPACDLSKAGVRKGDTLTFWLNRGQTYSIRAKDFNLHLGGSWVISTKPIAITASEDSVVKTGAADIVGDQLVPWKWVGKDYIIPGGLLSVEGAYVFGGNPKSVVNAAWGGGQRTDTLGLGQYAVYPIPSGGALSIQASEPVLVWHLSGIGNEMGASLVPSLFCTGNNQLSFVRSSNATFAMMLICSTQYTDAFTINDRTDLIQASDFKTAAHLPSGMRYASKTFNTTDVPSGVFNQVKNIKGKFHMAILNNLGASAEYGFYSSFAGLSIGPDMTLCQGDTIVLNPGGDYPSYVWDDGSTLSYRKVWQAGQYWVKGLGNDCPATDTIKITLLPGPGGGNVKYHRLCKAGDQAIDTVLDNGPFPGVWNDGYRGTVRTFTESGIFTFSKKYPCGQQIDSFIIIEENIKAQAGSDTIVCSGSWIVLGIDSNPDYLYQWRSPSGIWVIGNAKWRSVQPENGYYVLEIKNAKGCQDVDSVFVKVTDKLLPQELVNVSLVTVENDHQINVLWNRHPKAKHYDVYRHQTGKLPKQLHRTSDTFFIDLDVNCQERSYGYSLVMEDYCRTQSPPSTVVNSIHLKVSGLEENRMLEWTPYNGWTPLNYQIWKVHLPYQFSVDTFSYDKEPPDNYEILRCYRTSTKHNDLESFSNEVCVPFDGRLFIPNAFSPNRDGNNEQFVLKGIGVPKFHIDIYSRWGEKIFESDQLNQSWDGKYHEKDMPVGLYYYQIKYQFNDGPSQRKEGWVMLMR